MIKVLSLFSGYGGGEFGLKKQNIPYELVNYSEIDPFAIKLYEANFPDAVGKNLGDIKKVIPENLPDFDLILAGFPCQSFSMAGNRTGKEDYRGTLFWDIIRIAQVKKPKYMLLENVEGLLSIDDGETFREMLKTLRSIGYDVIWKVLNTKDYGIPQNRKRVWFICKYGGWDFMEFLLPNKEELKVTVRDLLDKKVDRKYYLTEKQQKRFIEYLKEKDKIPDAETCIDGQRLSHGEWGDGVHNKRSGTLTTSPQMTVLAEPIKPLNQFQKRLFTEDIAGTLCARDYKDGKVVFDSERYKGETEPRTYDGTAPTLKAKVNTPVILQPHHSEEMREYNDVSPTLGAEMGGDTPIIFTGMQDHQSIKTDGISNCLPTAMGEGGGHIPMIIDVFNNRFRKECPTLTDPCHNSIRLFEPMNTITTAFGRSGTSDEENRSRELLYNSIGELRKLTPRECFRLMGFTNDEIKLDGILSDSRLYRCAGNGWDANLSGKILKEMLKNVRT